MDTRLQWDMLFIACSRQSLEAQQAESYVRYLNCEGRAILPADISRDGSGCACKPTSLMQDTVRQLP